MRDSGSVGWSVVLALTAGCGAPPVATRPPPPVVAASPACSAPTPIEDNRSPTDSDGPVAVPAPYSVVAEGDARVWPLGETTLLSTCYGPTPCFARITGDEALLAPELENGLPPLGSVDLANGPEPPLRFDRKCLGLPQSVPGPSLPGWRKLVGTAGDWPRAAWLAIERSSAERFAQGVDPQRCSVGRTVTDIYRWKRDRWVRVGTTAMHPSRLLPAGERTLIVLDGGGNMVAFGDPTPELRPSAGKKTATNLVSAAWRGFSGGSLVGVTPPSPPYARGYTPVATIVSFARGSSTAVMTELPGLRRASRDTRWAIVDGPDELRVFGLATGPLDADFDEAKESHATEVRLRLGAKGWRVEAARRLKDEELPPTDEAAVMRALPDPLEHAHSPLWPSRVDRVAEGRVLVVSAA